MCPSLLDVCFKANHAFSLWYTEYSNHDHLPLVPEPVCGTTWFTFQYWLCKFHWGFMVLSLREYGVEEGHTLGWWVGVAASLHYQPPALHSWLLRHSCCPSTLRSCSAFCPYTCALMHWTCWSLRQACSGTHHKSSTSFCREFPLHMAALYSFQSNPQTLVVPTFWSYCA